MTAQRRQRLRLLFRDLSAAAAFTSMALSGQLPVWALVPVVAGLLLAVAGRRVLSGRNALTATVLLGCAGLLATLAFQGVMDTVVAACCFAGLVTVQRVLSAPTPAADGQVHLTSLLMISGGAALSGEMWFALCLATFAVLGSLSLGLGVLEAAIPEGAEVPVRPLVRQLSWGVAVALLGAAAFFIFFPRMSWNMAVRRTGSPFIDPASGLADSVRMDGPGTIKRNPRIIARIALDPDPNQEVLDAYWLARTFDTFTGDQWIASPTPFEAPSDQVYLGRYERPLIHQQIELLPAYGHQTLLALDPPVLVANATLHGPSGAHRVALQELKGREIQFAERGIAYTYHAYSPPPGTARKARTTADTARFLALPATLDPRVPALARQVVGEVREPLAAARLLEAHLKSGYEYTLDLTEAEDPLAEFLFERKAGHCEHFATALAVMLRSLGIPARVAGGFYGGERLGGAYVLRAADAHAWAQVLVPGRGFVTVDATPESSRSGQPAYALAWLISQYQRLEDLWRRGVVDYSALDQGQMVRSLVRRSRRGPAEAGGQGGGVNVRALLAAAAVAVVAYRLARRVRWAPRTPEAVRTHEAARFLEAIERRLRAARVRFREGEHLEELAGRLGQTRHPLARPLQAATRRYLEARFGGRPLPVEERASLLSALDDSLRHE